MPGVFIVEAFGQAAAALTAYGVAPKEYENKLVYLMNVEKARFRNPVLPDCELHLDIEAIRSHGRVWKYKGIAKVNEKIMADAGVDVADSAAVITAYKNPAFKGKVAEALETYLRTSKSVSDETITALRKTADDFTRSSSKVLPRVGRGSAALSVETVGEGLGELLGEAGASGRIEPIEAMHEALAGLGQGAAQIAISKSFEVSKNNTKALLRAARRAQIERVASGQPSEIEPAALNEALKARMDKIEAGLEGASVEILQFERALGSLDATTPFDSTLARVGELPGYEDYREVLQRVLNEDFGPEITLYTPMTSTEQATLEAGGVFDHCLLYTSPSPRDQRGSRMAACA